MGKIKIGSLVAWESQSAGYVKEKEGKVVQIVKAGNDPNPGLLRVLGAGFGMPRNHESYLVQVGNVAYWPLVKNLRVIKF